MSPTQDVPRINYAILCDDARREVSGKDILIGVYSGIILVPAVPFALRMSIWFECVPATIGKMMANLKISCPGSQTIILGLEAEFLELQPAAMFTPPFFCNLESPGDLVIEAAFGDDNYTEIRRLSVRVGVAGLFVPG